MNLFINCSSLHISSVSLYSAADTLNVMCHCSPLAALPLLPSSLMSPFEEETCNQ